MPKFAIITSQDGKTISVYKTREEAEKKARYSNIFEVIELPEKKITLDNPTATGV